ncbi:hypothetical protein [Oceanidesulfovibrio marinus]|uniref:Uncharacterized protein n=1 Tax=Oceanidesulfovibrio marinus TaxID=370038 RepID=A0A6P1ZIW3_9BACT|nr:hypothetical protein [Oceanidesulfovibrio marinus]TVM35631.1 hypothetical protein DQK91_02905 [Oceanidesulfovibrio marinus]
MDIMTTDNPKDERRRDAYAVQYHLDEDAAADMAAIVLDASRRTQFPTPEQVEAWEYGRQEVEV